MSSAITVRRLDPGDKAWLQSAAHLAGVSMEEFVRRLIRERRAQTRTRPKPSEAFRLHFGPENGVELPPCQDYGYRPVRFRDAE